METSDLLGRPRWTPWSTSSGDVEELERALISGMDARDLGGVVAAVLQLAETRSGPARVARVLGLWLAGRAGRAAPMGWALLGAALRAVDGGSGGRGALPLVQAADILMGLPLHVYLAPAASSSSSERSAEQVGELLRAGDAHGARAWVSNAWREGLALVEIERLVAHELFVGSVRVGHLAPALVVVTEFREACGEEVAVGLLATLAEELARALSRPVSTALRAHAARLQALEGGLQELALAADPTKVQAFNEPRFRRHILEEAPNSAASAIYKALAFGVPPAELAASLSLAAAERILRWELGGKAPRPQLGAGEDLAWTLALCSATRRLGAGQRDPAWLLLLMHAAAIVNGTASLDASKKRRRALPEPAVLPQTWDHGPEIAKVGARLLGGDEQGAQAWLRGYLRMMLPEQPLCAHLLQVAFEDRAESPGRRAVVGLLFAAAVDDFSAMADHPHRELSLCAAVRLFSAPSGVQGPHELGLALLDASELGPPPPSSVALPWLLE